MRITKIEIVNFKGISSTSINLSDEVPGNIITLIGLNESGKTTILEAISHFVTEDEETATFVNAVHQKSSRQELVPKDRKAAFTGNITIRAYVALDEADVDYLATRMLEAYELVLDRENMPRVATISRSYSFADSTPTGSQALWNIKFPMKKKRAKAFKDFGATTDGGKPWQLGIVILRMRAPQIVYFPTFLFNFPERIYLENDEEKGAGAYYAQVFQDVLDSEGSGLSIKKHIIDRIDALRSEHSPPATFFAHLLTLDEKNQLDAVTQKIANEMSRVIFGAWGSILGHKVTNKRVQVQWYIDTQKENAPYLQVSIVDGLSPYFLSERSLGFRWFFSFLLFTQFRKGRQIKSATIFLFDEPAANLHSKAQMKLLDSFTKIAKGETYIVYSTHSHYMINPLWLEKAYIVENRAVDFDDSDEVSSFAVRKTDIEATKYRKFVAENPTKTTYFQPVLDALDVVNSPLDPANNVLVLEGKYDFHPFVFLQAKMDKPPLSVFPASGAGAMGNLINLLRGRGVKFCILLDDDKEGRDSKTLYEKEYLLPPGTVYTLRDIAPSLKGKSFEGIYKGDVASAAKKHFATATLTKRQYSLYFQELLATGVSPSFPETETSFKPIFQWAVEHVG